ncbi:MAG: hypothetical protein QOI11_1829 [Candidatus Eremiobacteraeota bacterium]|nr:hypothetical protein [Candidatus Eremiobacteraeota bacterium]
MTDTSTSWPAKGYEGDQPWQADEPDVTPRAGLPILSSGSVDPQTPDIFRKLAELDEKYQTPISRGETAHGVVGAEEMAAVRAFRRDYNVLEDPSPFGGDNPTGREVADNHIGPWTLEALFRAHDSRDNEPEPAPEPEPEPEPSAPSTWPTS